jgi:hypothetical protein
MDDLGAGRRWGGGRETKEETGFIEFYVLGNKDTALGREINTIAFCAIVVAHKGTREEFGVKLFTTVASVDVAESTKDTKVADIKFVTGEEFVRGETEVGASGGNVCQIIGSRNGFGPMVSREVAGCGQTTADI